MGVIHRAYDRLVGREVAYKRLRVANESSRARLTALFEREYDTLARLSHPNIVETFDFGLEPEGPYYTMELLTGSDLTELAPMPYRDACRILRDVASALSLVHSRRLLHRDVTPANIRLTGDGRAKLIDFGALTRFGQQTEVVGTPSCMAPECLADAALDQRADLYSLGAVAYWLLTRKTSVRARKISELEDAWNEPVPAPSLLAPDIPQELDALVLSLLSRDPLARPASAAHAIERLTVIADLAPEADERRVAYSYLAHPPLSDRGAQLSKLDAALDRAAAGRGGVTIIEATAGLGRSALLDSVALNARLAGHVVLRATGNRRAGGFGLARALTEHATMLHQDLAGRPERTFSFLGYLEGHKPKTAAEVAAEHASVVDSVGELLVELSRRAPVAIVIDDLHASDPESVALLAALTRDIAGLQILLVVSVLARGGAEELSGYNMLASRAERLSLDPLSQDRVVELVQSVFGNVPNAHRLGRWLWSESGGNPATCMDLSRLLLGQGAIRYTLGAFTLPHSLENLSADELSQAIVARVGNLGPHAERVAKALALHDGALHPEQLAQAVALSTRDVLLALEALSSRGVAAAGGQGFALTSGALRMALESTLSKEEKSALHVRLARAILRDGAALVEPSFEASAHLFLAGEEDEAAELVASLGHIGFSGESAARWVFPIEAALKVFDRQGRSKEQRLALMIPLIHAGFHAQLAAQRRHIENAVQWMSLVCGMTIARKLSPYLGAKLGLLVGLLYASLRRAVTPAKQRLGRLNQMLAEFVGLVCAGTAAAVSAEDNESAIRWNSWLAPLAVLPPDSSGFLLREFCLATVEVGVGEHSASAARYARIMPRLLQPVAGLGDALRLTIYRGCMNGRAQAEIQTPGGTTLALADELGQGDPFFAPHAECARMGWYGFRGDQERAEHHRVQAELLALRGGNSWSAEVIIARRCAFTACLMRDAMALVQLDAWLDRLLTTAPNIARQKVLCQAWLAYLRGRPEEALGLCEGQMVGSLALASHGWRYDHARYATLLNATGQYARAKAACELVLGDAQGGALLQDMRLFALPQLARAEVGLGNMVLGTMLMDRYVECGEQLDSPLILGQAHRERAELALMGRDAAAFEVHYAAMCKCFRATRTPALVQQCDELAAQAVQHGLRAAVAPRSHGSVIGTTTELVPANNSDIRATEAAQLMGRSFEPYR